MMTRGRIAAPMVILLALSAGCGGSGDDGPGSATPTVASAGTPTAAATPTAVLPTATGTARDTATANPPPTLTRTPTVTQTGTITGTPTGTAPPEPPVVTYFGVARADDLIQTTDRFDAQGRPIFERVQGQGMTLVLEGRRGTLPLAEEAYDQFGGLPGAQIIVSRPLGDGSLAVCDFAPPIIGGIPATMPLQFSDDPAVVDAINDFGCRMNDGTGVPRARTSNSACTRDLSAEFTFVDPTSDRQFCLPIARAWAFPTGDTIVAARLQDIQGNVSAPREIVVRVAGTVPFGCEDGLGERVFTPARPGSVLLTSASSGDASFDPWVGQPLHLCAGPDLGNGMHALALREDAVIGLALSDGSTLCARFSARGSDGILDCDAGTAHDVRAVQDDAGATRIEVDTGLGLPAGTGAASLSVPVALRQVSGVAPADCAALAFGAPFDGALTTTTGTAEVVDAQGVAVVSLSVTGSPFNCARWRTTDSAGTLVLPFPAVDTAVGDVAVVLVLRD